MVCGLVWLQEQIPKSMCLYKIELHAQSIIIIIHSIVNIIRRT